MPFAYSTNYKLAVNKETVRGTPVATGARFLRIVDGNFKPDLGFVQSNEINAAHRQVADTVNVSAKGSGTFNGELSYATYDYVLESLFGASFTAGPPRVLSIGQTSIPLTLQEQYGDLTTSYHLYTGQFVNSFSLNLTMGQIVTCSFGVMGNTPTVETTNSLGTIAAANTNAIINPIADVRALQEGASPVTLPGVQSITLNVQNDIAEVMALGAASPLDMAPTKIRVSGTVAVFKQNSALLSKLLAGTASKLVYKLGGASSKNYELRLANLKFTSYDGGASGSNPIVERFNFDGLYDVTDSALKITATD